MKKGWAGEQTCKHREREWIREGKQEEKWWNRNKHANVGTLCVVKRRNKSLKRSGWRMKETNVSSNGRKNGSKQSSYGKRDDGGCCWVWTHGRVSLTSPKVYGKSFYTFTNNSDLYPEGSIHWTLNLSGPSQVGHWRFDPLDWQGSNPRYLWKMARKCCIW